MDNLSLDACKIFVGGLSWQTTEETLRYHFEQYGEVVSVEVMRDRDTGNPRGFAFVVFKEDSTVDLVMNNLPHEINHKVVDVKRAQARGTAPPSIHGAGGAGGAGGEQDKSGHYGPAGGEAKNEPSPEELQNKIFVGGLPIHLDNNGLKNYFNQFGTVTDAIVMMDMAQNRSRGFGFVTFENGTGGAQKALAAQPLHIDNKYVEIKLAQPKGSQASHKQTSFSNTGLRNANAALASAQSKGEFAGFAASFGRKGWKAGYGSYAFGKGGWGVDGWETFLDIPNSSGFSFDMVEKTKSKSSSSGSSRSSHRHDRKRDRRDEGSYERSKRSRH